VTLLFCVLRQSCGCGARVTGVTLRCLECVTGFLAVARASGLSQVETRFNKRSGCACNLVVVT
jgi:hypothetical protein